MGSSDSYPLPVGIDLNAASILHLEEIGRHPIHQRDAADDGPYSHNGLGAEIDHGCRGQTSFLQLIDDIRAHCRALSSGEYEHLAADLLAIQLVAGVDHHPRSGVNIAQE